MSKASVARVVKATALSVLSCAVVAWAGGGWGFVRRPVGIVLLVIWFFWWWTTAWYRPLGRTSKYSRRALGMALLLIPAYVVGLVLVPWEYAHFAGPIPRDGALAWVGLALFACGALLGAWAMRTLRGSYTMRLNVTSGQTLVTTGPYAVVRNPGYLGNILALLGVGLALSSLIGVFLTLVAAVGLAIRIRREERMLLTEFGDQFRAYVRRTYRLVPLLY